MDPLLPCKLSPIMKNGAHTIHTKSETPPSICLRAIVTTGALPEGPDSDPLAIGHGTTMARAVTSVASPWELEPRAGTAPTYLPATYAVT